MKFYLLDSIEELCEKTGEFYDFLKTLDKDDANTIESFVRGLVYGICSFTEENPHCEYDNINNDAGFICSKYSIKLWFEDDIHEWDKLMFEVINNDQRTNH